MASRPVRYIYRTMSFLGRLLPLFAAAILAVAALALPSAALAHPGHDHRAHAGHHHHAAPAVHAFHVAAPAKPQAAQPAIVTSSTGETEDGVVCGGGACCGMACSGCGISVLDASDTALPPPVTASGVVGPTGPSRLAGSEPDGLLRPPTTLV